MDNIFDDIKTQFDITEIIEQRKDLSFITIAKEHAISLITYLRDYKDFSHLVLLTAVDWLEDNKFQLTYLLNNPDKKTDIGVRVKISRDDATMQTAHQLWEQVATYQRELKEMFGIDFPGSPDVDKPFILEGWDDKPPYRRDFDTKEYSEDTYFPRPGRESNDPAEYMRSKMYPDEEKK
jgi:NADH-quinone oxidoreductase subunit C